MKKRCNGGNRTIKKGASTDPKKHFEVINFILGHFVNFLEEIYQENFLDVSSPLNGEICLNEPKMGFGKQMFHLLGVLLKGRY